MGPNWVSSNEISMPRLRIARDTSPLLTYVSTPNGVTTIVDFGKTVVEKDAN